MTMILACCACTGKIGGSLRIDESASDAAIAADSTVDAGVVGFADAEADANGHGFADATVERDASAERDAGCTESLAASLTRTPLAGVPAGAWAHAIPAGGAVTAWADGTIVHAQRFDALGRMTGVAVAVNGNQLWGVAASDDATALLVSRGDILAFVLTAADGTAITDQTLMGGVPHDVINNEWFGSQLRAGRLDWTGTEWVVYATVQRLWPDNIAHYGDTLRTFTADGSSSSVYWGWGCSHSMDVRLAHNAAGIGAVCSSDCYPEKGVLFMHRTTLFSDTSGNCAGYVGQKIGDVASTLDGYMASFVSAEGRTGGNKDLAIVTVGNDYRVGSVRWLTETMDDENTPHLARFGAGFLAAYIAAGAGYLWELDPTGAPAGAPEMISADLLSDASDFFLTAGGEVAWVARGELIRLAPACP